MSNTSTIFRLKGAIQRYDWGGFTFLPELLHIPNTDKKPFAEYWLGAHAKSPAMALIDQESIPLDDFIQRRPRERLGSKTYEQFGMLPYLLKVQDVRDMLSIQVHPSKRTAEQKFEEENIKGIPLQAPERNYKDANHKPELLSPLSDMYLLHGFKEQTALEQLLQQTPELHFLESYYARGGYQGLYTFVMTMPQEEVNRRLRPLISRITPLYIANRLEKSSEHFWAVRAAQTFNKGDNMDRGIFSIYLFNVVKVIEGEALFQDAGLPHAYLEGHTMEIMANSDNVLRGGLTPKHIDVNELLEHIRFQPTIPNIIRGEENGFGERRYITPAADFQLSRISLAAGEKIIITTVSADIYFLYKGQVTAAAAEDTINMRQGESLLAIPSAELHLTASSAAVLYRATAP